MRRWFAVGVLALAAMLLTSSAALAATQVAKTERSWLRAPSKAATQATGATSASYGKWIALLALLGGGGFALYKRRRMNVPAGTPAVGKMKITAVTRISPKGQIVAISIQGRTLLVGATDSQITRLGWLEDEGSGAEQLEDDYPEVAEAPVARGPTAAGRRPDEGARRVQSAPANDRATRAAPPMGARFRELLADAIGLEPKRKGPVIVENAAVDELARATEDRYVASDARRNQTQRIRRDVSGAGALIDVEGQAQGLVARLNRPLT